MGLRAGFCFVSHRKLKPILAILHRGFHGLFHVDMSSGFELIARHVSRTKLICYVFKEKRWRRKRPSRTKCGPGAK